ncbi:RraA family protein [Ramlibacter monticola]|uniref:Putative 4-hydroxy-4-methyl-2-oxoglutarate aldolase n=1 Tax=Ramlibacter monticola TaxID=1926872 RepID=A0A936YWV5_9BURK|nr:RraA family protein [Ramlibacter monticola]MBL0390059.1 RraA family protein [Ramlibacter monticola]
MFEVHDLPAPLPTDLVALLARVETATIGHVLHDGFVDPEIRSLLGDRRVVGCAVTVRIPAMDSVLLHHAVSIARPGDFLVIERCGDRRHACLGGMVTHAAKLAGVVGAVIDGPATDMSEIRACDFPVWARGLSPITTKQLGTGGALNVPVTVGGQVVCPGDVVLADESGVVVLARDRAEALARKAIGMQEFEVEALARMRAGAKLGDLSGATARVAAALQSGGSSK